MDTSPEAAAVQLRIYREMSPSRKIRLVEDANHTARVLALSGLVERFPRASREELHLRLFHLVLGNDLATKAYGPLPETRDR